MLYLAQGITTLLLIWSIISQTLNGFTLLRTLKTY